jgi:hypothetical protein
MSRCGIAENYLGQFELARSDINQAIRLSPRNPGIGYWHLALGEAELGLGKLDATIDEAQKAIGAGERTFRVISRTDRRLCGERQDG